MQDGTGLGTFAQKFPSRFFDVGIAEGHAAAMAAGMAKQGMLPVFAVYASFLQRSYDMLIHDIAIQKLHVVLAVDRAGLVGEDGETHHGVFDAAFLSTVPGMQILCPSSYSELCSMLEYAIYQMRGPVAVRYPRGGEGAYTENSSSSKTAVLRAGRDITLVGYGILINQLLACADLLSQYGLEAEVVKLNCIAPIDLEPVCRSVRKTGRLLAAEESYGNPVGTRIASGLLAEGVTVRGLALCGTGEGFVTQGTVHQLLKLCGLDGESLCKKALEVCKYGEKALGHPAV